jgi:hypothetical protein
MFKKLVGLIPFHPSSIDQLIHYGKTLKKESKIRNIGLLFMGIGALVQIVAIFRPPQPTITNSANDLLRGGFRSAEDATHACLTNEDSYGDELAFLGITCSDIAAAKQIALKRDAHTKTLFVLGQLYYATPEQYIVQIKDNPYWLRPLWLTSTGTATTKQALIGTNSQGLHFYILYESGNIVLEEFSNLTYCTDNTSTCSSGCIGTHSTPTKCNVQESTTVMNETQGRITSIDSIDAKGNDIVLYNLTATNIGEVKIEGFVMRNTISDVLDYANPLDFDGGLLSNEGTVTWPAQDIEPGNAVQHHIRVKVKEPIPNTPVSSTHPGHYDLLLTNYYGNATQVKLPSSIVKTLEYSSLQLPQASTMTGLATVLLLLSVAVVSYLRSKLIIKEITILRKESR